MSKKKSITRSWSQEPLSTRFWRQVRKTNTCWVWTGTCHSNGYGQVYVGGEGYKKLLAHRASWILMKGEIPPGVFVLHHCDNKRCVNPKHLFLGSQKDNIQDMLEKRRHGFWLHPDSPARGDKNGARLYPERLTRGENLWSAKLSEEDVKEIRRLYAAGILTQKSLRERYEVCKSTIQAILNRKTWKHVP